jgi:hypothetical protein
MANATKAHDNRAVCAHLSPVGTLQSACEDFPWLEDILAGVVWLKSEGDTATRPLRQSLVYLILCMCDVITVDEVHELTGGRRSRQHAAGYAAAARVASKAVMAHIQRMGSRPQDLSSISNL